MRIGTEGRLQSHKHGLWEVLDVRGRQEPVIRHMLVGWKNRNKKTHQMSKVTESMTEGEAIGCCTSHAGIEES